MDPASAKRIIEVAKRVRKEVAPLSFQEKVEWMAPFANQYHRREDRLLPLVLLAEVVLCDRAGEYLVGVVPEDIRRATFVAYGSVVKDQEAVHLMEALLIGESSNRLPPKAA